MAKHSQVSILQFLISFFFSLCLALIIIGFLNPVLDSTLAIIISTAILMTIAHVISYFFIQHAFESFRDGFLSKPLNIILALSLLMFWFAFLYACLQFPEMFLLEYISIAQNYLLTFIFTAIASGFVSYFLIQKTDIKIKNLSGIYLGMMFFFIHLILARALNHPALSYNVVLFEADAGPWMEILASPESAPINRAVHPLSLIIIRPIMRLASFWMGEHYPLGAMLVVSATAGLCVFMAWLFIKRATNSSTYAFLFALLLGSSASHLLFGSLTENYIFGAASLIFFFLLIQSKENRFSILVPAGLLLFGITITNIVQGVIGLFFNKNLAKPSAQTAVPGGDIEKNKIKFFFSKFGINRLILYCFLIIGFGVLLTLFTNFLYPNHITYFFSPKDIAFEFNFVEVAGESPESSFSEKLQVTARTMALYGVVGPNPIEAISEKPPFPTIDLKTFDIRTHALASYKGLANIPLVLWLILLASSFVAFIKNIHTSKHLSLMLGLLGALGFNFIMHLFYGTELFIYTPYWMYAIVFFMALSLSEFAEKIWFDISLTAIVFAIMINNFGFIFSIMKAITPFYAAMP